MHEKGPARNQGMQEPVPRWAGIRCTLRVTPAMVEVSDLVALLETDEQGLEKAA